MKVAAHDLAWQLLLQTLKAERAPPKRLSVPTVSVT